ncbi:unnamed protein product [Rhizoctonia solani]|uniref:Uncharacterized protein n=1 Tax=Rhizoctonia solani TaxID=456999 RepID=A0A8H3CQN3_9AGAM|nr:unnamed protein product [Rhizoctonia solani]CAE6495836.1 unnamed protein product [Rhizoctonia solani]
MGTKVTERTTEYMTIRIRNGLRRGYIEQIRAQIGHLGTSLCMFPRVIRDLERQVISYVTQRVEHKIRKHMRKIRRQIRKQRSLSPLETIGNVITRISKQAQRQINRQLGSFEYYQDPSNPLHTDEDRKMTIAEFCRLDLIGQVIMMECFQEADHAFILVHVKGLYPQTPSEQMTWIRLERGLKKNGSMGYFQTMFMKTTLAYDAATISYQLKSITPPGASPIGENTLVFNELRSPVTLKHLVSLLGMMDESASIFSPFKDNSWVFSQTIIDCMEPYQSRAIRVRHPEINHERRMDLKRRFTSSITDLYSYGFTSES